MAEVRLVVLLPWVLLVVEFVWKDQVVVPEVFCILDTWSSEHWCARSCSVCTSTRSSWAWPGRCHWLRCLGWISAASLTVCFVAAAWQAWRHRPRWAVAESSTRTTCGGQSWPSHTDTPKVEGAGVVPFLCLCLCLLQAPFERPMYPLAVENRGDFQVVPRIFGGLRVAWGCSFQPKLAREDARRAAKDAHGDATPLRLSWLCAMVFALRAM